MAPKDDGETSADDPTPLQAVIETVGTAWKVLAESPHSNPREDKKIWRSLREQLEDVDHRHQQNLKDLNGKILQQQAIIDGRNKYSKVKWLDMSWAKSDLKLEHENKSFRKMRERYFFHEVPRSGQFQNSG